MASTLSQPSRGTSELPQVNDHRSGTLEGGHRSVVAVSSLFSCIGWEGITEAATWAAGSRGRGQEHVGVEHTGVRLCMAVWCSRWLGGEGGGAPVITAGSTTETRMQMPTQKAARNPNSMAVRSTSSRNLGKPDFGSAAT